ncbi:MAG: hypothetical protein KKB81_03830 [Candidatus Margulisbacteria bacterium]|nr:hypothetical protein [Candidatus Margulisiibacteriota bacterium]MBU1729545.1 hypothetical protein [Candidatus Margulisiibacteriota bacterium]MBU1955031.1 hypothetical protein [Candidatus Margulisiibacteriota bacterium]
MFAWSAQAMLLEAERSPLLDQANALKSAEKYEDAEKLYDEVLSTDPDNLEALNGKDDCRIMLEPIIPMQMLAIPMGYDDPEYLELLKREEEAQTPWDKRRAEIALDRFQMKYMGRVFSEDEDRFNQHVKEIIDQAIQKVKSGESSQKAYIAAEKELNDLQSRAHQNWKGHGPQIIGPAINKLNQAYQNNHYPIPTNLLILSFDIATQESKEKDVYDVKVSVQNRFSYPVVLIDFQIEGKEYKDFSWQRPMYGVLNYNEDTDRYYYNFLSQQETIPKFNLALLFPDRTTNFQKKMRIPDSGLQATIQFVVIDNETIGNVYIVKESSGNNDVYEPADFRDLKQRAKEDFFVSEETIFPGPDAIIFNIDESKVRTQDFTL